MANRITTTFDFQERGQGLKKIKADVQGVDGAWNKAKVTAKGAYDEFTNSRAAQAAVAGIIVKVGTDAVNAASDLEESINAVNTTFGESADEIRDLADASVENYGVSERAFGELAVAFSGFAQQVAGEGGNVSDVIDDMATRVADFASVHNLDMADAMTKFQSALAGETEAVRRFGIDLSAAAVGNHAYATGIADIGDKLTESEKVQSRYSLLMQETEQWAGDFANTSEGLANQQRILAAEFENLQATLGRQLLPTITDGINKLTEMATVVQDVATAIETAGDAAPDWLKDVNELWGPQLIMDVSTAPIDALGWAFEKLGGDADDTASSLEQAETQYWRQNAAAIEARITAEAAADEFERNAQALRDSAAEATYNADAHDEMRRIQEQVNAVVEDAADAQRDYLDSIKHTRDEVGKLKRDIDDEQAWIAMQEAFDRTDQTLKNVESSALDNRSAIVDLKEEVLLYGEALNLPDEVITQLVAMVERGALNEVEALLARWGNGVTLPIKPVVIGNSRGTNIRVDESGNVRLPGRASGGPVMGGRSYVVGERGPEILTMGGNGFVTPNSKLPTVAASGGVTIGQVVVQAPAGADADAFGRAVREAIRRETRWSGPVTGWSAA